MKDHAWYRDALSAWLDNELSVDEHRWVEEHIRDCPECQQELNQLRRVVDLVQRLPEHDPGTLLAGRVMDRIRQKQPARPVFRFVFQPAMAMVLLIALGGLFTWRLAPEVSRQTMEKQAALPQMDEPAPMPLASAPVTPPPTPQLKAVPDRTPVLRAAPTVTVADPAVSGGGASLEAVDPRETGMESPAARSARAPLPAEKELGALAFSLPEEMDRRVAEESLLADREGLPEPAPAATARGTVAKMEESRSKSMDAVAEKPVAAPSAGRSRVARKMSVESSPSSAALRRPEDESLFLKKDRYETRNVDVLLRTEAGMYPDLARQLREAGCSFLESRVGSIYEVQLRLSASSWADLQKNLQGKYRLEEHPDPGQPWFEVKSR